MMGIEQAPSGQFTVGIDDLGIARVRWASRTRITGELAAGAMAAVDALRGDRPGPVLVAMAGVDIPSWDARQTFSRPCSATRVALVGGSPTDHMIAKFNLGTDPYTVPRQFFYREHDAVHWLLEATAREHHAASTAPPASSGAA